MKKRAFFLAFAALGLLTLVVSCKKDTERTDPLELTDNMAMTVSVRSTIYNPTLFDNYLTILKRDSLNGTYLDGRRLSISTFLEGTKKLQILLTNWESNGGHTDGIVPKAYILGLLDTTRTSVVLGDSVYSDKPQIRYSLADDYVYVSDTNLMSSINITYCDPIRKKITGTFMAMCVALPPNSDTIYVSGSFNNMKYYKSTTSK